MDNNPGGDTAFVNPFKQYYVIVIPEGVVAYRGLSPGAKIVYGRLQRYAGRKGIAFPNIPELSHEIGLGERQTKDYLNELVDQKFIHRERVFAKGNVYKFYDHPCLRGSEVGSPRVNSGAFSIGRAAAQQTIGRDAAQFNGREPAPQEDAVSLLPEESHLSGSFIPPTPFSEKPPEQNSPEDDLDQPARFPHEVKATKEDKEWSKKLAQRRKADRKAATFDPNSTSEVLKRFRADPQNGNGACHAPISTAAAPSVGPLFAPSFPERWNVLVPERTIDPALFTERPAAYQDPIFQTRFDEICEKFRSLIQKGAELDYLDLFRKNKDSVVPWWKMALMNKLGWTVPGAKSGAKQDSFIEEQLRQCHEQLSRSV